MSGFFVTESNPLDLHKGSLLAVARMSLSRDRRDKLSGFKFSQHPTSRERLVKSTNLNKRSAPEPRCLIRYGSVAIFYAFCAIVTLSRDQRQKIKICFSDYFYKKFMPSSEQLRVLLIFIIFSFANSATCFSMGSNQCDEASNCNRTRNLNLTVGESLLVSLEACTKAVSSVGAHYPQILVDDDPGMPNLAILSIPAFRNLTFKNALGLEYDGPEMYTTVNLSWQPGCSLDPERNRYDINFYAKNNGGSISTFLLRIYISYPEPIWVSNTTSISTRIGCPERITMVAKDRKLWTLQSNKYFSPFITVSKFRSIRNGVMSSIANLSGSSLSVADWAQQNGTLATFEWTPQRGQEAQNYMICFNLVDFCRYSSVQSICVNISVLKCQVCISSGQTLQSIAADYQTDFLSFYSANVAIQRPFRIPVGAVLNSGILYRVQLGDTLSAIADRFFTTKQSILGMNPDIAYAYSQGDAAMPGDRVCLSLPICEVQCKNGSSCSLSGYEVGGLAFV